MTTTQRIPPSLVPLSFSRVGHSRGASLFVSIIFLLVLSMLGVVALRSTVMQQRMAGNSQDWNLAFQAAEAALRDGEADISGTGSRNPAILGQIGFTAYPCTNGLCQPSSNGVPIWQQLANGDALWQGNPSGAGSVPSVQYGTYTGATALTGVLMQPRYVIEALGPVGDNSQVIGDAASSIQYGYRITAIGFGNIPSGLIANAPATQVVLQSVYNR